MQQRNNYLRSLSPEEAEELLYKWRFWAREEQVAPPGNWRTWLFLAGRGCGKTRAAAEWVRENVCGNTPLAPGKYRRLALVGETAADVRDVMIEGDSGLLGIHPKAFRPKYEPSKRRLTWPNGAVATSYSAEDPEQLRGPQHDASWCDELAKWRSKEADKGRRQNLSRSRGEEVWHMLQMGLRLGDDPRSIITTTPRPIPLLKEIMKDPGSIVTRGRTADNRANLAPQFFQAVSARYDNTRLGRQELEAEILEDVPGALWTPEMIEDALKRRAIPDMQRVVVAIDPSGTSGNDDGDWIGIVATGQGIDGRYYVLGDWSCQLSPAGWGKRAVDCAKYFLADFIVGERNYGGAMVEYVIRAADPKMPYREVVASRGKVLRAEPVAALYEQERVTHIEPFTDLERQMLNFSSTGYVGEGSPDRVDALVHGLTQLAFPDWQPRELYFGAV